MGNLHIKFVSGLVCVFMSVNTFAVTYEEINSGVGYDLTQAQIDHYISSLIGTRVTSWHGKVTQVSKNWFGGDYSVLVDMDGGVHDVQFDIPKHVAIKLNKNTYYTFSGTIGDIKPGLVGAFIDLENVSVQFK